MSHSQELIQKLIGARSIAYGRTFEDHSADRIASWQSEDLEFNDIAMDEYHMTRSETHAFFVKSCGTMSSLEIFEQKTRGTAERCTWEMLLQVTNNVDEPTMELKKGQKTWIRGVAVQEWNGDLSDSPTGIRGWKIVGENDYMCVIKDGMKGRTVKLS